MVQHMSLAYRRSCIQLIGGEEMNGLELWRFLFFKNQGGAAQVQIMGEAAEHSEPGIRLLEPGSSSQSVATMTLPRTTSTTAMRVAEGSAILMVARPEGVIFARSARRLRMDKRWSEDCVNWVQWAPWHRYKDADDVDGEVPEGVDAEEVKEGVAPTKIVLETRKAIPRDVFISKKQGALMPAAIFLDFQL